MLLNKAFILALVAFGLIKANPVESESSKTESQVAEAVVAASGRLGRPPGDDTNGTTLLKVRLLTDSRFEQ